MDFYILRITVSEGLLYVCYLWALLYKCSLKLCKLGKIVGYHIAYGSGLQPTWIAQSLRILVIEFYYQLVIFTVNRRKASVFCSEAAELALNNRHFTTM